MFPSERAAMHVVGPGAMSLSWPPSSLVSLGFASAFVACLASGKQVKCRGQSRLPFEDEFVTIESLHADVR